MLILGVFVWEDASEACYAETQRTSDEYRARSQDLLARLSQSIVNNRKWHGLETRQTSKEETKAYSVSKLTCNKGGREASTNYDPLTMHQTKRGDLQWAPYLQGTSHGHWTRQLTVINDWRKVVS